MRSLRLLAAALALGLVAEPALAQEKLVINSFGGAYEEAHRRLVIEPFEQMHNIEIEVVTLYSADALAQLRAQRDNPQFDVIHFSGGQEIIAAREGLLAPIKPDELENHDELYPFAVEGIEDGRGPVYSLAVVGLLYNSEQIETPPTSWDALFEPSRGEQITIANISNTYGLFTLLMINKVRGGDLTNLQPGFDAVKGMLENGAQIVNSSPELQQAFAQGGTWLAAYAQDYAHTLRNAGLPVQFVQPQEGSPASYITVNAVANRPNLALAKKFVDFSIRAEAQVGWAQALRYSPTNRTAEIPADLEGQVIIGEEAVSKLIRFDPEVVNEKRPEWTEAWNRAIAR